MSETADFLEAENISHITHGIVANSNNVRVQATFYMLHKIGRLQHVMHKVIQDMHYGF